MKTVILRQAFEELKSAVDHYEEQQAQLGLRLSDEVQQHIDWITENADVPRIRHSGCRHVNLKVFPYYIAYIVRKDTLWIIAMHIITESRNTGLKEPNLWSKKIQKQII
jgi:hypothetical protein